MTKTVKHVTSQNMQLSTKIRKIEIQRVYPI